ncbi:hypothetical protein SAMN04488104_102516 [Algoriphagus faecimaris]|uniref:Uncharacterized protein n=1 Tax=Algoriphagus faecimaris TaxID=686796 RepID=A0A1G6TYB5_9BACT|nr:hypothetical protein [Algoriphagus faecimaris]SDD34090.1 hypothetical protein SAMN04488104_102516 [Algoriphagus faecimaris]
MDVNLYKESIKKITVWDGDGSVFGFIDSGSFMTDYIYEFYCSMEMLNDLSVSHKVSIVPGEKGIHFSRKGGHKINHAKFLIFSSNGEECLFQICLGTEIYMKDGYPFRADISVQTPDADDSPNQEAVILIHDSKYSSLDGTISLSEIKAFATDVSDFDVPKPDVEKLIFSKFPFLKFNCLISNISINSIRKNYAIERNVKQIGKFFPGSTALED